MGNVLGLSATHESNLRKLATYLWWLPKSAFAREHKFNMSKYDNLPGTISECSSLYCGSIGCAIGHGPYAGIQKKRGERWNEYANRVFGGYKLDHNLLTAFFGWAWYVVDDTPRGASRRILYGLRNGFPRISEDRDRILLHGRYKNYRPKPDDFVTLPKAVLKRLGFEKQPV